MRLPEIQFYKDDSEDTRLEKLRRLAQAVSSIAAQTLDQSISPVWTGAHVFNVHANAQTIVKIGEASVLRGDSQDGVLILYGESAGVISSVTLTSTGANLSIISSSASATVQNSVNVEILGGKFFRVRDAGNTDWVQFSHDGTNFTAAGTNTTKFIFSGMTAQFNQPARLPGYTVATLPAGTVGDIAYVTDALAPAFAAAAAGGGAVKVPVFYDGANWITV